MPKKIDKLTAAQERRLIEYREEWLSIGRSTSPADRVTAERVLRSFYAHHNAPEPYVWWVDGPASGSLVRTILRANLGANLGVNLRDHLGASLRANLRESLRANLGDHLCDHLWANLWENLGVNLGVNLRDHLGDHLRESLLENLGESLWDHLGESLGESLRESLRENLWENLGTNLLENLGTNLLENLGVNLWDHLGENLGERLRENLRANLREDLWANLGWTFWGQHESYWTAYYRFFDEEVCRIYSIGNRTLLDEWCDLTASCGWSQPFQGIVFACERPARQSVDEHGRLHHATGPAMICRDGWEVYAWHNVRVPEQVICAPSTLTPQQIASEENAQVRQVMVERVGIERVCQMFKARSIDKHGTYELLILDIGDGRKRPYLKMLNPSVGVWHVEGVHPNCSTVQAALNWRNGLTPETIDEVNGANWIQQGDVILKPAGAKIFKSQPAQLT